MDLAPDADEKREQQKILFNLIIIINKLFFTNPNVMQISCHHIYLIIMQFDSVDF